MVKAASDVPAALAVSAEQDQETEGCEGDDLAPAFKRFWEVGTQFPFLSKAELRLKEFSRTSN